MPRTTSSEPGKRITQARWWILTAPYSPENMEKLLNVNEPIAYVRGQRELTNAGERKVYTCDGIHGGGQGTCSSSCYEMVPTPGYHHIQAVLCASIPVRLSRLVSMYGNWHFEATRSKAALEYVWKEETRVEGTQFEKGTIPMKRNDKTDWQKVKDLAKEGKLEEMDPQIYVCHYRSLKAIAYDNLVPQPIVRNVKVYWGNTGVGKSRRAWEEAGMDAYPKDPRTKFWDGYRSHRHVVMDEFRGDIDIAHLLRWFDRYPVNVEIKGSAVVLSATTIWITSNIDPRKWFPTIDKATLDALMRRLEVVHMLDAMLQ